MKGIIIGKVFREVLAVVTISGSKLDLISDTSTERYQLHLTMGYLKDRKNRAVCALYGLRRTGKTTIMEQAIKRLIGDGTNTEDIIYILGEQEQVEDITSVFAELDKMIKKRETSREPKRCLYAFIDEIGFFMSFISHADRLYNFYTRTQNMKIVIAGTNILSLYIASLNSLYDRLYTIQMHHLTFYEHCLFRLEEVTPRWENFKDYLRVGGLFSTEDTIEYLQTSVIEHLDETLACGEPKEIMRWFDHQRNADKDIDWKSIMNNICLYAAGNVDAYNITKFRGFADDVNYLKTCDKDIIIDSSIVKECAEFYHLGGMRRNLLKKNEVTGLLLFLEQCGFIFNLLNSVTDVPGNIAKMYLTFPFFRFTFTKKLASFAGISNALDDQKGSRLLGDLLEGCVVSEYRLAYPEHEIRFWREAVTDQKGEVKFAECDLIDLTLKRAYEIKLKSDPQYAGFHYLQESHPELGFSNKNCTKLCGEDVMQFVFDLGRKAYCEVDMQETHVF